MVYLELLKEGLKVESFGKDFTFTHKGKEYKVLFKQPKSGEFVKVGSYYVIVAEQRKVA